MKISKEPQKLDAWDFMLRHYDGWVLDVVGGLETSIRTDPWMVLRFRGVDYIDCPTEFSHASIRFANPEETETMASRVPVGSEAKVYVLEAETMAQMEPQTFFIVAQNVESVGERRKASNHSGMALQS